MKYVKKICKNCKLYDPVDSVCTVTVIHEGEYLELKVKPNDKCHWERIGKELSMFDGIDSGIPIQQVVVQYDLDNKKIKIESPEQLPNPFN